MTSTSNFGFYLPLVNSPTDQDLWGGEINTNLTQIDGVLLTALAFVPTTATGTITVTAPTVASTTTGSSKLLYLCNATGGAFAANLPAASTCSGMTVGFKKTDASGLALTITPNGTDKIDGAATNVLTSQYAYIVLVSDGSANWEIIAQTPPAAIASFVTLKFQKFSANGTYTPSTGMLYCWVRCVGGGNTGGAGSSGSGGGGGAGEYAEGIFSSANIGASQSVTIGGATGGTTSLGSLMSALGGSVGGTGGLVNLGGIGGTGGTVAANGFNVPGLAGQPGGGATGASWSGMGGSSPFGTGGNSVISGNGNVGLGFGSGGSGGFEGNSAGAGKGGYMVIKEFCSQ